MVDTEKRWDTQPTARFCALPVITLKRGRSTMATKALLVRLEAKSGKEDAVEEFLLSALPLVEQEPGTKPWLAVRFGPSTFGIIDAFPDEAARETHLGGPVGKALAEKADELFASAPDITNLDVIANKL
jgi:quinol monooxygenase YgiN